MLMRQFIYYTLEMMVVSITNIYNKTEIKVSSFSVVLIMLIDLIFKISLIPTNHDYLKFFNLNIIR